MDDSAVASGYDNGNTLEDPFLLIDNDDYDEDDPNSTGTKFNNNNNRKLWVAWRSVRSASMYGWKFVSPGGFMPEEVERPGYPAGLEFSSMVRQQDDLVGLYKKLRLLCFIVWCTSIIFWIWAMENTRKMKDDGGKDLGIYSFASTFGTSSYILYRTRYGTYHIATFWFTRIIFTLSHLIVTANYGLGLLYALTIGRTIYPIFATYCTIFMILWTIIACQGYSLMKTLLQYEIDVIMDENNDTDYNDDEEYYEEDVEEDILESLYRS